MAFLGTILFKESSIEAVLLGNLAVVSGAGISFLIWFYIWSRNKTREYYDSLIIYLMHLKAMVNMMIDFTQRRRSGVVFYHHIQSKQSQLRQSYHILLTIVESSSFKGNVVLKHRLQLLGRMSRGMMLLSENLQNLLEEGERVSPETFEKLTQLYDALNSHIQTVDVDPNNYRITLKKPCQWPTALSELSMASQLPATTFHESQILLYNTALIMKNLWENISYMADEQYHDSIA